MLNKSVKWTLGPGLNLTENVFYKIFQWKENSATRQKYINGLFGDIWSVLQKSLNFSYSMVSRDRFNVWSVTTNFSFLFLGLFS